MNDNLEITLDGIKIISSQQIKQDLKDGLKKDEIKNFTDADKFYYDNKNFKRHLNEISHNIDKCRYKCMEIIGEYDKTFNYEACKKGCHIESPYYCEPGGLYCTEEMNGKFFYFEEEGKPFKGDCKTSGNKNDCEKGKTHFNDIWNETHENTDYMMSNEKITEKDINKCKGSNDFYDDKTCNDKITLKKRFINFIISHEEYKKEDKSTYDDMVNFLIEKRKKNNEKKSDNNTKMKILNEKYNKLQEGMTGTMSGRLEDNKLKSESEMYKKIAISILGITLLLITAKKLNSL